MQSVRLVSRRQQAASADLCTAFCTLYIAARGLSTFASHGADSGSNNATPNPMHSAPPQTTPRGDKAAAQTSKSRIDSLLARRGNKLPDHFKRASSHRVGPAENPVAEAPSTPASSRPSQPKLGGLAPNSIFADDLMVTPGVDADGAGGDADALAGRDADIKSRSPMNMEPRLNPNPNARARWIRLRVIRNVRRRGRLTREMRLARTERSHTSKSRFFKTSVKKLAPLARQIAGKSIDDAIIQMRFSKKKAAREILKHLLQARNEAVVIRGMGLAGVDAESISAQKTSTEPQSTEAMINQALGGEPIELPVLTKSTMLDPTQSNTHIVSESGEIIDASNTPPLNAQLPSKRLKKGAEPSPADIYVAQAWVNRGPYGKEPSFRARGRTDILRPPHTGISVMLKEEKTRSREKMEKEMKAVRKRLNGKGLWTALQDRPLQGQSQHVLW